jgi:hypothetical protein
MESPQDNRGPALVAITVTFLILTWVSVLLRFFVRIRLTKSFDADDWLMAISLVSTTFLDMRRQPNSMTGHFYAL